MVHEHTKLWHLVGGGRRVRPAWGPMARHCHKPKQLNKNNSNSLFFLRPKLKVNTEPLSTGE